MGRTLLSVAFDVDFFAVHGLYSRGTHRMGTGTLLRVQHSGFAGHADQAMGRHHGWSASLEWLRDFVENKVTVETREPR